MMYPMFEEFLALSLKGLFVPVSREIAGDMETPVTAFLKLKPLGACYLLESVGSGKAQDRYSFIGISHFLTYILKDDVVSIRRKDDEKSFKMGKDSNPLAKLEELLSEYKVATPIGYPRLFGGAVGYFGYDMVRYFEHLPRSTAKRDDLPDACFMFTETMVIFDHVKSRIKVVTLVPPSDSEPLAKERYRQGVSQIDGIIKQLGSGLPLSELNPPQDAENVPSYDSLASADFERRVVKAKEHIRCGDIFQVVISRQVEGRTQAPPFQIYRALRMINPSPYMFFLDYGDFQLVGSSPEALVKLEDGMALVCPIAGTLPRGASEEEDKMMGERLLADEKEKAEHVMLVDLGRNDLGKVCEPGSVVPTKFMAIERYSHVMHLVSNVVGKLSPKYDMFDLFKATFPAGTVTGAPKIRAMEIIEEMEGIGRGPYAGAVGYFSFSGNMDMCITIRTIVMRDGVYSIRAGAGIVADSDPAKEYLETQNKIKALKVAINMAEAGL